MDLDCLRKKSMIIAVSVIVSLGFMHSLVFAEEGRETGDEVIYEMQQIILSGRIDNYNGEDNQKYDDGSEYVGYYSDGKRSGFGTYTFANKDCYVGEWDNDLMLGEGEYTFADGAKLVGDFENGELKDGSFTYSDMNGEYKIEVVDFEYSEEITAAFTNGDVYYGVYNNDTFSGDCKILYFSGDYYEGQVLENKKSGTGTYIWKNGAVYIGEWEDDMMNGFGTYYYSSGLYPHLEGMFVNNQPIGTCEYYIDENVSIITKWENGKCVSQE